MAKKVSTKFDKKFTEEAIRVALEAGDAEQLAEILAKGYNDRTVSINPQIQKKLAKTIMDICGYEPPEKVRTSSNSVVGKLEELQKKIAASGNLTPEIAELIGKQMEESTTSFVASDGVQKGWQAFVIECVSERMDREKHKKPAAALIGAVDKIVDYGAKRAMTAEEQREYDAKKAAGQSNDEEEELEE